MRRPVVAIALAALLAACGATPPASSATPPASSTATPAPTPSASGAASLDHAVVYVARDLLPPTAFRLAGAGGGASPEARIASRIDALALVKPTTPGEFNVVPTFKARLATVKVSGDLATLDYAVPNDDWGGAGSAGLHAFVQQIVYTASEEPGIRRVLITQNGGKRAIIGGEGLVVDHPATREDVLGYAVKASTETISFAGQAPSALLTTSESVDSVAVGLARFAVRADPSGTAPSDRWTPTFRASVAANDEAAHPELGKWVLTLEVDDAKDISTRQHVVDRTPLRSVSVSSGGLLRTTVRYQLGLDDLRPWRVGLLLDPTRIVVDVGGAPGSVAGNDAVYAPKPGETVGRPFTITGMARAFEATVSWRLRDSKGAVVASGHATATIGTSAAWGGFSAQVQPPASWSGGTLDVYQVSMKDGSDLDVVSVPILGR